MCRSSRYFIFFMIAEAIGFGILPQYDLHFVSVTASPENGIWDLSKARLIGRERLVNGTITLKEDLDNDHYSFSLETFCDAAGDGNFKLLPFYISRTPVCEAFRKYRQLFSKNADYGRRTDFPINKDTCPLPRGTYFLKNIKLSALNWPGFLPSGYIRGNFSYYRDNKLESTYTVTVQLRDKKYR